MTFALFSLSSAVSRAQKPANRLVHLQSLWRDFYFHIIPTMTTTGPSHGFYGISTIVDYLMPDPLYAYIKKLVTIVEGNPKAPFSIATTPMCRGGRYSYQRF